MNIARMMGRFPTELEAVGGADKTIEIKTGNKILAKVLGWLDISIYARDLRPAIPLTEYSEMLAHLSLEADEYKEAQEKAKGQGNG